MYQPHLSPQMPSNLSAVVHGGEFAGNHPGIRPPGLQQQPLQSVPAGVDARSLIHTEMMNQLFRQLRQQSMAGRSQRDFRQFNRPPQGQFPGQIKNIRRRY